MYYNEIAKIVKESNEKKFIAEMVNGRIEELTLEVNEDNFNNAIPVLPREDDNIIVPLPWYIARDIISITPASKYVY